MKVLSVAFSLLLPACFSQTAAGLRCDSECAACWKTGDLNGVDIKFSCKVDTRKCGDADNSVRVSPRFVSNVM